MATIRVTHVGLNFADMFACLGLYSATPKGVFVPGLEFSGVVEAVNDAVNAGSSGSHSSAFGDCSGKGYQVGDRVFGVTRFGGYTSRLHADTRYIRRLPPGYSLAQGAALPAQALTAWYGLVGLGALRRGDGGDSCALIHSAGGGTGMWAVRICQYYGVHVVATVGSTAKVPTVAALLGLDARCMIDRSVHTTDAAIRAALQKALAFIQETIDENKKKEDDGTTTNSRHPRPMGFDYVFDSLLGEWFQPAFDAMRPRGRLLSLGPAR